MITPLEDKLVNTLRRANNWFFACMSRASVGLLPSDEQMYLETLGTLSEYDRAKEAQCDVCKGTGMTGWEKPMGDPPQMVFVLQFCPCEAGKSLAYMNSQDAKRTIVSSVPELSGDKTTEPSDLVTRLRVKEIAGTATLLELASLDRIEELEAELVKRLAAINAELSKCIK